MRKPSIVVVIPARGGSKSVPRKNIKDLGGIPLIAHSMRACLTSTWVTTLAVSSEDQEIREVAEKYGEGRAKVIERPAELATDDAPSLPTVVHAVVLLEEERGEPYDYVVMMQCTTPLVKTEDIDGALKLLVESGADAVMSVVKHTECHPIKLKRLGEGLRLTQYVEDVSETQFTRQKLDPVYRRNGAIYASRRDIVMKEEKLYGGDDIDTRGYEMPEERSADINSPVDFLFAETLYKAQMRKN